MFLVLVLMSGMVVAQAAVNPLIVTCIGPTQNTDGTPTVISKYTYELSTCSAPNVFKEPALASPTTTGPACGITVSNLAPQVWCVRVTATSTVGKTSAYSNTASGTIAVIVAPPNPPTGVAITVNTVAYVEKFRWWGTRLVKLRNAEVPLGIECGAPVRQHPGYNYLPNVTVPGVTGAIVGRCEVPVA